MYLGDYITGAAIAGFFNTRAADGTPLALAGSPALAVYAAGNTSESTAGVVLTTNFDSRTGLHHFTVDTNADSNFYSGGSEYVVVLTSGTIGGISAVGRIVAEFSITNRSDALLSQLIYILGDPEFGLLVQILARLPEALVDGRIDARVGEIADNAITNAAIAASAVTEIQSGLATASQVSALNNLSTAQVLAQCTAALETAISELTSVPSGTPTTKQALMFLYMALRNQSTTTANAQTIRNDSGVTIATATLADDGTTMTKGEFA
jgi:hypothetical protein